MHQLVRRMQNFDEDNYTSKKMYQMLKLVSTELILLLSATGDFSRPYLVNGISGYGLISVFCTSATSTNILIISQMEVKFALAQFQNFLPF